MRLFAIEHYARLPRELAHNWDQWLLGYARLVRSARTNTERLGQLLGNLGRYQVELETYRRFFAHHLGARPAAADPLPPAAPAPSCPPAPEESKLKPWMLGLLGAGIGLALGVGVERRRCEAVSPSYPRWD